MCWVSVAAPGLSLVALVGLLFVAAHQLLIAVAPLLPGTGSRVRASAVAAYGLVALQHVESPWRKDQTHVPCIGEVLNHGTTKEVPKTLLF